MIEFYVPTQTSKPVTISRWAVGYGIPVSMLSYFLEAPSLGQWWSMLLLVPIALASQWLATEGINKVLLKTVWGQKYLQTQFLWVAAQRDHLKAKGESGNNVYLDTGDFAASFVAGIALLLCALGVISFLVE
jgi:hypothetical protein